MYDTFQFLEDENTWNPKSEGVGKQSIITGTRIFHLNINAILFSKSQSSSQ